MQLPDAGRDGSLNDSLQRHLAEVLAELAVPNKTRPLIVPGDSDQSGAAWNAALRLGREGVVAWRTAAIMRLARIWLHHAHLRRI